MSSSVSLTVHTYQLLRYGHAWFFSVVLPVRLQKTVARALNLVGVSGYVLIVWIESSSERVYDDRNIDAFLNDRALNRLYEAKCRKEHAECR